MHPIVIYPHARVPETPLQAQGIIVGATGSRKTILLKAIKQYRLIGRARHRPQWVITWFNTIGACGSDYSRMRARSDSTLVPFGGLESLAQNASSYCKYFRATVFLALHYTGSASYHKFYTKLA